LPSTQQTKKALQTAKGGVWVINSIIEAIAQKLGAVYGQHYKVYTENTEQDFEKPCFYIEHLNSSQKNMISIRYKNINNFAIRYFSPQEHPNEDCHNIGASLFDILEYITAGGSLLKGTGMETGIEEGVLLFFVSYNMFILKPKEPDENMERIDVDVKTEAK